ncbi:MAG TPA: DUF3343 domain-containing protein [Candidatus Flavonifractor intestinipullorum]|uniref:DUF3343 domain-containing protein n=1 Tax=Candidatus Flavonifractor intestinipullorum TaxID=2838587 RepID=A0A9D2MDT5_9FIRM|nr:DUF3343 domain-containing protein [Candidatus Flavonifractor intestinipullorum]
MSTQIATFHTHFGAIRFHKLCKSLGDPAVMMPVPRALSASCGTCVRFTAPFDPASMSHEDLDSVYAVEGDGYRLLFRNEEE